METREEEKLKLLSGSLRELLDSIYERTKCPICGDLIKADSYINMYNTSIQLLLKEKPAREYLERGISSLVNNYARLLSFRFNSFEISYLPNGKKPIYTAENVWERSNRVASKPARIIQKLLVNKYTCRQFEQFNNYLKAGMLTFGQFRIVCGEEIRGCYLESNYYKESGSLGSSCMREYDCQEFLDIYCDNAKLLVFERDSKVLGRALLWEIDNKVYMDRVYVCMDYLVNVFIEYAEKNGWYHLHKNSVLHAYEVQEWCCPDDNYSKPKYLNLSIKLKRVYDTMPYLDSFRYYNYNTNTINTNYAKLGPVSSLTNTDGEYCDVDAISCQKCGTYEDLQDPFYHDDPEEKLRNIDSDTIHYSHFDNKYLCEHCSVYCDGIKDFIEKGKHNIIKVSDPEHSKVYSYPEEYILDNMHLFNKVDDKYFLIN